MRPPVLGPAADVDASCAYLFECERTGFFGITLDAAGTNLSDAGCGGDWRLKAEFALGVREAITAAVDPEPVMAAIRERGYYVWREWPQSVADTAPGIIRQMMS
jgi:hypothetical protein